MRVSYLTWGEEHGPFERVGRWLAGGFADLDEEFDAVTLSGPPLVDGRGVRRVQLGAYRARASVRPIAAYLREARPALTLVAPGHLAPFAVAAGIRAACPVVPWEQSFGSRERYTGLRRATPMIQRALYPFAPAVAVTSRDLVADLLDVRRLALDPSRVHLLSNPIDADEIRAHAAPGVKASGFRIVTVGALVPAKGLDVLIDAFRLALPDLPHGAELHVIGEGPLRAELQLRAALQGIGGRIWFAGRLEDPYRELASAHLYVHAARWEGFGVAIGEALALGLPVVATACPGGPRQLLRGDAGVLVPPDNPTALAAAIAALAADPGRRMELSRAGRARVAEYAPAHIAQAIVDLSSEIRCTRVTRRRTRRLTAA